jgi:hypothetical protein
LLERLRPLVDAEHRRLCRAAPPSKSGCAAEDMDEVHRRVSALIEELQQFLGEPSGTCACQPLPRSRMLSRVFATSQLWQNVAKGQIEAMPDRRQAL